jgi:glutamate-1-semialdehyde 2,1-aminomutase
MPGGVAKGAYFQAPYPLHLAAGDGAHVTSVDGRRLLDLRGHHTAAILGHRHPEVDAAVREQLERGVALGGPTAAEAALAEELCRRLPSVQRVRFTTSGSEATGCVLRLARGWSGRHRIAKFEGAYHGSVDAVDVSVRPPVRQAGPPGAPRAVAGGRGLARGAVEDALILPYDDREAVARLLTTHRHELAAVLFDPRAGILPIDLDFVRFLRALTAELRLLLVLDEVVSFRLGYGGLQGLADIRPDLTTLGKIVGGGFPAGAFGGRADLMDLLDDSRGPTGFHHSGTFSGHPVAMVAGLATLRALPPLAYGHLNALGEAARRGATAVFERHGLAAHAAGDGSLFSFHFAARAPRDYRALAAADAATAQRVALGLIEHGVLPAAGLSMNAASLPMTDADLEALFEALDRVAGHLTVGPEGR